MILSPLLPSGVLLWVRGTATWLLGSDTSPMDTVPSIALVATHTSDLSAAQDLARQLVASHLVAAAHISSPLTSWYWWQGELCQSTEWRVDAVTLPSLTDAVYQLVRSLHNYALPSFTIELATASLEYASWVAQCVEPDSM